MDSIPPMTPPLKFGDRGGAASPSLNGLRVLTGVAPPKTRVNGLWEPGLRLPPDEGEAEEDSPGRRRVWGLGREWARVMVGAGLRKEAALLLRLRRWVRL